MKRDSKRVTSRNKEVATIKSLRIIQHYDLPTLLEAIDKHLEENGYNQSESDKAEENEEKKQTDSQLKEIHDDEAKMRERIIQRMKKQEAKTSVEIQFRELSAKRRGHCKDVTEKQAKSKKTVPKKTTKDHTKMSDNAYEKNAGKRKKKAKRVIKRNVSYKTPASEVTVGRANGCENAAEKQKEKVRTSVDDEHKLLESLIDGMSRLTIHDPVPIPEVAEVPQTPTPEVASKNRKRKLELQDVIGAQLKKLRTLVENEEKLYDSVVDGLSSYTIKDPGENSVPDLSPSKKCKIEVAHANKATSVSAPIRACAPVKDLRKVLQRRQGLCY